jgi:hypothetical protein
MIKIIYLVSLYPTCKSSENHNFITITPNLVGLEPMISLRRVEYYYAVVLMFGVMLILPIYICLY